MTAPDAAAKAAEVLVGEKFNGGRGGFVAIGTMDPFEMRRERVAELRATIAAAIREAVAAERERCAKVCEAHAAVCSEAGASGEQAASEWLANAIRKGGE